jgi:hypothetical protein
LESESPGSARNGQVETEFRRTATVGTEDVEAAIVSALVSLRTGDAARTVELLREAAHLLDREARRVPTQ